MGLMLGVTAALRAASPPPDYNTSVRSILSRNCFKCHGPDEAARKGKLRLDLREVAIQPAKSGAVALVPGRPDSSELFRRLASTDPEEKMPPPETGQRLSAAETETLRNWVAGGAEYQQHWAFVPPRVLSVPSAPNDTWSRNSIDLFVLQKLQQQGLTPSAEADPYSLLRRLSLDLTGLPPTPEEMEFFLKDRSARAYEHQVDRLLGSPHYGERWGRRWMDLARYADTNGYEKDRNRTIWPWRDWVIRALNSDMPFDQFTVEQLAGDLLPQSSNDQRIATGFHRNTMLNEEGGIDPLEFRFHAMTDRVATTGTTWLGLTLGCAQCHTHKYDPIPHQEYYQMMAFLNNADEPELDLPNPLEEERHRRGLERADRLVRGLADGFPLSDALWHTPRPSSATAASGEKPQILEEGSVLFNGATPEQDTYTIILETGFEGVDQLRLETLTDASLPKKGPGRVAHGNFVLSELRITAAPRNDPARIRPIKLRSATADVEQTGYSIGQAIDGRSDTGWSVDIGAGGLELPHTATFHFDEPVSYPGGAQFVITLEHQSSGKHLIGRPRLSLGSPVPAAEPIAERRRKIAEERFNQWLSASRTNTIPWRSLKPSRATSNQPKLTVLADDSVLASGDITKSDRYDLTFDVPVEKITALRLEALPDDSLPAHGPGMAYYEGPKGDFFLGELQLIANGKAIAFAGASHSYAKNSFGSDAPASAAIDGDMQTGWSTGGREGRRHEAVFVLKEPLTAQEGLKIQLHFGRHYACSLGRFRLSVTTRPSGLQASDRSPQLTALLQKSAAELDATGLQSLRDEFLLNTPELADAQREIQELRRPVSHRTTLVLRERPKTNPRPTFRHHRGEYLQPAESVEPGVLSVLSPFLSNYPRNRLGLAQWLLSTNNPLTARVTINRQWQAFFGRGLVRTTEDFGYQGESPSHPELLDWLSVEWMQDGWSMKRLHKRIVMSATYRQSSRTSPDLRLRDAENRWLARGPSVRLDAEQIRDAALFASGLLSMKMEGPGVYPPQPVGVMEAAWGGARWPVSEGEDRYRRSVYTFVKRTAPFALFNTFDAPTGESCLARREVSNTPLQALTLLNDIVFLEVAQALGRSLADYPGTTRARIEYAFRRCMTRPPTTDETASLQRFLEVQRGRFTKGELNPNSLMGDESGTVLERVERAAWTALARALLNLDEMIVKG